VPGDDDLPLTGPDHDPLLPRSFVDALPPEAKRRARQYGWIYTAGAIVLLPWIVYLAVTLPRRNLDIHYKAAWVGFDVMLVLAIVTTAFLAFRIDPRIELSATTTATLLFVDAWFDIMTSNHHQVLEAVVLALLVEIPAAVFTLSLARRVNHRVLELATGDPRAVGRGPRDAERRTNPS
jgi:hypothetical protein